MLVGGWLLWVVDAADLRASGEPEQQLRVLEGDPVRRRCNVLRPDTPVLRRPSACAGAIHYDLSRDLTRTMLERFASLQRQTSGNHDAAEEGNARTVQDACGTASGHRRSTRQQLAAAVCMRTPPAHLQVGGVQ